MRACFLGQNVCALGYGVAMVQTPPLTPADQKPDSVTPVPSEMDPKDFIPLPNRMFEDLWRHTPHHS
jgi:hypothetical protein